MSSVADSHRSAVGCSKIAQALGLSRFGTPYELWAQLTGREDPPDLGAELRVALGEPMEDVLKPFVERRLGCALRRDRREYRHPLLPLVAHVDYRVSWAVPVRGPRDGLDIKTSLGFGARHRFGADATDQVDDDVTLQCQGYMALTGARRWYVAALVPGPDLRIYPLERDGELIELIERGIGAFWRCVQTDTPPDPATEAEARQRWSAHRPGTALEADDALLAAIRELSVIKAAMRTLEADEQRLKDRIVPALADAERVTWEGRDLLTYRANKPSRRTDWRALAEALLGDYSDELREEILREHTAAVPGARVLRINYREQAA